MKLIYIGGHFYLERGTMMSSIYGEDGAHQPPSTPVGVGVEPGAARQGIRAALAAALHPTAAQEDGRG